MFTEEQQCGRLPGGLLLIILVCDGDEQSDPGGLDGALLTFGHEYGAPKTHNAPRGIERYIHTACHIRALHCAHRCADKQLSIPDST